MSRTSLPCSTLAAVGAVLAVLAAGGVRTFGYTALVVDPPNGQIPALAAEGQSLAATRNRGTFNAGE